MGVLLPPHLLPLRGGGSGSKGGQPAPLLTISWSEPHGCGVCVGSPQEPPHTSQWGLQPSSLLPPSYISPPACSKRIFQMDISILFLVIKEIDKQCLAWLVPQGPARSGQETDKLCSQIPLCPLP